MTTIYIADLDDSDGDSIAFPTLAKAKKELRDYGTGGSIRKITVAKMGIRELLCAMHNREAYAEVAEIVYRCEAEREE